MPLSRPFAPTALIHPRLRVPQPGRCSTSSARDARTRAESFATARLVLRPRRLVRLEVQPVLVQQSEKGPSTVQPQPTKHASGLDTSETRELPQNVLEILLADSHHRVARGSTQNAHARPRNSPSLPYSAV